MKTGKKEQALRAAREDELSETLLQAVAGLGGNAEGSEAVEQSSATEKKEKTVKTRKKAAARHNARTPVHNGHHNGKTIRAHIVELARHKHGCTNADVFALTERIGGTRWPTVSMPQVVESQGIPLSKLRIVKKKGEATRYFVVA